MSEKSNSAVIFSDRNTEQEYLRIENGGKIFWRKDGKMELVDCDEDLAKAFKYLVESGFESIPKAIEESKEVAISVRLSSHLLESLDKEATNTKRSRNSMIAFIIEDYLK